MNSLPICLNIKGKAVSVIGGGVVAARRSDLVLRAGGRVAVFAPDLGTDFFDMLGHPEFQHVPRHPAHTDLEGSAFCFVATQNPAEDEALFALARSVGVPVNVADRPDLCDFTMPSIVDRSPLIIAISTAGTSPILGRMLKARLESIIPAAYGRVAGLVGQFRDRVAARLSHSAARRRFWEEAIEGEVGELVLAGDDRGAEAALRVALDHAVATQQARGAPRGEVYLVGAGPGDPDLLTFRALRLMQKADVVLYDRLIGDGILNLVRREAERISVGKAPGQHTMPQEDISRLMVKLAGEGKRVLRLKGGDPFLFGRGGEEIEALAEHGIPFQVCPGITAASGCAAYSGVPLTHRDHAQACLFVTGHGKGGVTDLDWTALLRPRQTVAIYMGLAHLDTLTEEFIARGADPELPAAVVDNATRPNQQLVVGTLKTLADKTKRAGLRGPAIIIVGTVVTLRDKLGGMVAAAADTRNAPAIDWCDDEASSRLKVEAPPELAPLAELREARDRGLLAGVD
ncbi:MAG: uroporphyrinogen-III C-methyltransferase [Methylacidiphilales bacterium]|nr:uroporphyrinogen-III C-methyltransferase [Candidatus Methylacidiphilales bacterium]